jgi:hypothetical protein
LIKNFVPREDHYEGMLCANFIAAVLYNGPSSVAALYPKYFNPLQATTVAFVFALAQFGIEEFSTGGYINTSLGAANMLAKYKAHLFGLKEFIAAAPGQWDRLNQSWCEHGE